ncbi:MAG: hypothetical protein NPIRA03_25210 [Nitrospirales bacterium]|nr:MAG: hypothetical protein NPIRA03_25210 [Nitrospirales bacterium]
MARFMAVVRSYYTIFSKYSPIGEKSFLDMAFSFSEMCCGVTIAFEI